MNESAKRVARFGLLTALTLVLGLIDRAIPLSALLGGAIPGIRLGLANTVLLYAVYLMDWKRCVLLMLTKVLLSGFLFGSLTAILYSLAGGVLSLLVMLSVRRKPAVGALAAAVLALAADILLLSQNPRPSGQRLWAVLLIAAAFAASTVTFILIRKKRLHGVVGTSLLGAVAHNVGQILMACAVLNAPKLLITYLPFLVGIGAAVGCLTGIVTERVLKALGTHPDSERIG
ncbi:MAG: Gx transporter family protein [Clostridia bacterium]|nr:Gx transporter family protein [Clostridia bacterium]